MRRILPLALWVESALCDVIKTPVAKVFVSPSEAAVYVSSRTCERDNKHHFSQEAKINNHFIVGGCKQSANDGF